MTGEAKTLIGIGIVTLALFIGGIVMLARRSDPTVSQTADPAILVREDAYRLGAENPQVTLVEFSDFQCPFCAQAHPVVEAIVAAYPDKVAFVFRHFPLLQHQYAVQAGEAAEAAGAQGKYWEMTALIFKNQTAWAESSDALPLFQQYAGELELDLEQFNQAMADHTFRTKVQQGVADGNVLGVNSTPSFFINGEKFSGSMNQLKTAIEAKLQ